ncbi:MAG: zinc-ribbon domain-containing protein [Candidatus Omnitrophica bacterium]|nr:zinc-ribbon domain-containing protein [Candidatus Omnitrophota bacterium]
MFCSQCGTEIIEQANFCSGCGAAISGTAPANFEQPEFDDPILVLKPVFIGWVTALSVLPLQLFFTVWGAGFFGGFGLFAVKALKLALPVWSTFVFFGCLFFFGIPLTAYMAKKKSYEKTEYRFFKYKLDYFEGFFTVQEKSIDYCNIVEVNLIKGPFQRKYGLGTILLSTPAAGFSSRSAMSGIRMTDIKNPDKVYNQIKGFIEESKNTR